MVMYWIFTISKFEILFLNSAINMLHYLSDIFIQVKSTFIFLQKLLYFVTWIIRLYKENE